MVGNNLNYSGLNTLVRSDTAIDDNASDNTRFNIAGYFKYNCDNRFYLYSK